ncbi:MAG: hypothetical protein LBT51_02620 [Fusobacteriaceae bacterium]|jgi:hypothetical protein|nr:hypothetical protein [Fusobacteriaceae bacterium]
MNAIGGYFELELCGGEHYHKDAIRLNTARNCLEYILKAKQYEKIHIPYYTCEVILEPMIKCNVEYEFYRINEQLEPAIDITLEDNEAFLYTNYFGLKQNCVERLAAIYSSRLIVDNAQAFYAKPLEGIDTFYSARKFFGVADGAYLYTNKVLNCEFEQDLSYERMAHLLKRIDINAEAGYDDFKMNDTSLIGQPIKKMSFLTESILSSINYQKIKEIRKENYAYFDNRLKNINQLNFMLEGEDIPMVYPFLSRQKNLKQELIKNKIFGATYWSNIFDWCNKNSLEYFYAENIAFLPIDQRNSLLNLEKIKNVLYKDNVKILNRYNYV